MSQSNAAGACLTTTGLSYTTSTTTHTTPTEESPLFIRPDPGQQDEDRKAENNEIPDGGLLAWTQVLTGHLVVFNVWGYITSYGFFQEYYVRTLDVSPANASWIGAVQMFLVHFLATFSGRAMDAGYLRQCITLGCFFQVSGALATSFGTKLWHFWLAQGIVSGIGHGLVFSPMISLYATYFNSKRVMAVSLASCGAATGGMIFPVVAYQCFNNIGFAWTVRIMAAIILFNSVIIVKFTRSRIIPRSPPPWVDFSAFRERPYLLFSIGSFLIFEGIYFAYIYLRQYAQVHTDFTASDSLLLLILMNGVGVPSRIASAFVADRWLGAVRTCIAVSIPCGIAILGWIGVHTHVGMFIWATVYGLLVNCAQSQLPAANAYFGSKDPEKSGARVGMITTINSIPLLTGPYIAGQLIALRGGDYLHHPDCIRRNSGPSLSETNPSPKANWQFDLPASNINTACNQQMLPQCTFADVVSALKAGKVAEDGSGEFKPIDVLIIPGGPGTRLNRIYDTNTTSDKVKVPNTQEVQDFLTAVAPFVRHSIITVCTGSHVLSQTGLLDGRQVTTNSARYDDVAKQTGDVKWQRNRRWLRDSVPKDAMSDGLSLLPGVEIWSSAGITAGIDVMLEFISEYYGGIEVGIETAKRMEYRWEREKEASHFL
ncbi:Major facilitator superfamily domain general substrate transporter [Penicillium mononematosum]|uniref:Major facilitator superfamily domain general substrate transporter n=1 Tax=Penicillium mononematosum TaxID=268346 RepID=UPI002549128C|nr:Major facilitator superfamily domain general substrate transporter [Penicillium mononematosum]KAJ6180368.1 Major facilitator superfamily domain general substrate transporter [Penicillium mononematosum]